MAQPEDTENATQEVKKSEDNIKDKNVATVEAKEVLSKKEKAEINKTAVASKQKKQDLIAMQKTDALDPIAYEQMKLLAKDYLGSDALPNSFDNELQILRVLQAGRKLGVTDEDAISGMYYVNGQLNIYGKLTPTVLRNAGYTFEFYEEDDESTTVTCKIWKGESKFDPELEKMIPTENVTEFYKDTFTASQAEQSGYMKKDKYGNAKVGWRDGKNRQRKLRYEVLSLIIHTRLPHVLSGVAGIGEVSERYQTEMNDVNYKKIDKKNVTDRMNDVSIEGEVIDQDEDFKPSPVKPVQEEK